MKDPNTKINQTDSGILGTALKHNILKLQVAAVGVGNKSLGFVHVVSGGA